MLILTLLALARLYLGQEWPSGALIGMTLGLAWVAVVGIAYRQRAKRPFSGGVASLIFFGAMFFLFSWQVQSHARNDLAALQSTLPESNMSALGWWNGG